MSHQCGSGFSQDLAPKLVIDLATRSVQAVQTYTYLTRPCTRDAKQQRYVRTPSRRILAPCQKLLLYQQHHCEQELCADILSLLSLVIPLCRTRVLIYQGKKESWRSPQAICAVMDVSVLQSKFHLRQRWPAGNGRPPPDCPKQWNVPLSKACLASIEAIDRVASLWLPKRSVPGSTLIYPRPKEPRPLILVSRIKAAQGGPMTGV